MIRIEPKNSYFAKRTPGGTRATSTAQHPFWAICLPIRQGLDFRSVNAKSSYRSGPHARPDRAQRLRRTVLASASPCGCDRAIPQRPEQRGNRARREEPSHPSQQFVSSRSRICPDRGSVSHMPRPGLGVAYAPTGAYTSAPARRTMQSV